MINKLVSRFLTEFVKKYKVGLILSLILGAIYGVVNTASYWLIASMVNILFKGKNIESVNDKMVNSSGLSSINNFFKNLLDSLIVSKNFGDTILKLGIIILVIFFVKNIFRYFSGWEMKKVIYSIEKDLKTYFLKHITKQSLGFIDKVSTGKLFSYYNNDITAVINGLSLISLDIIVNLFTFVSIVLMLFSISVKLTLFIMIVIPVSGVLIAFVSSSLKRKSKRKLAKSGEVNQYFSEVVNGFPVIKSFVQEKIILNLNDKKLEEYKKISLGQDRLRLISSPINEMLAMFVGISVFVYAGKWMLGSNEIASDDFIRFFTFVFAIFQPIKVLGTIHNKYFTLVGAIERVFGILDKHESVYQAENGEKFSFQKDINFNNVNFSYPVSPNETILHSLSLSIKKGEKIAFVGPSGGGKSTITKILLRFYDINSGSVIVDGKDIKEFDLSSFRKSISYVDQNIFLFNDSIEENILFGDNNKHKEIDNYIKESGSSFVYDLPEKEKTLVGEKGNLLSGGQKQRITIARAMIKDAPIMIFDEATSALDNKTEKLIQDVIFNKMKEKTVIIVAHRLSTIQNCDKIVLLKSGEIEAIGSHDELLKTNMLYKELYTSNN